MTMQYIRIYQDMFTAIRSCKYRIVIQKYRANDSNSFKIIQDDLEDFDGNYILRCSEYNKNHIMIGSFNTFDEALNHINMIKKIPLYFNNYIMKVIRKESILENIVRIDNIESYQDCNSCCVINFEGRYITVNYKMLSDLESNYYLLKPKSSRIIKEFRTATEADVYKNKLERAIII